MTVRLDLTGHPGRTVCAAVHYCPGQFCPERRAWNRYRDFTIPAGWSGLHFPV